MKLTEITSKSPEQTQKLAEQILEGLPENVNVIALQGDLGSGKTTFVQGLAKTLGVKKKILSPTFILMRTYNLSESKKFTKLFHLDLYRIDNSRGIEGLGLPEIINGTTNLVVIELAEKMNHNLFKNYLLMKFKYEDDQTRKITLQENYE